ncbi:MAG: alpha/beta fold hydrolase, partial [Novosphingobium sp.]|nr:alpha/beta fold hydrolase [Novosphingobium sp.]
MKTGGGQVMESEASTTSVERDPTTSAPAPELPANVRAVEIVSDGTRMAGNFWRPADAAQGEARPCVLMIHGWGGLKSHLNSTYAPRFCAEGWNVLTFDFRGWGESEGRLLPAGRVNPPLGHGETRAVEVTETREVVDPVAQSVDVEAAIAWLEGEPGVDRGRMALWGSSLGGGLALRAAIDHPEFSSLISQIANSNPRSNWLAFGGEMGPLGDANIRKWQIGIARGLMPSVPDPSAALGELVGAPHYPEFVPFDPMKRIDELQAHVLVIDAADEELFDADRNGGLLHQILEPRGQSERRVFPGQHYDLYSGDSYDR